MAVAKFLIKYGQSSRVYGKANRIYGNSITLKPRVFHSVKELREGRKSIENIKCSGRSSINRLDILTKKFVNLRSTITVSQSSPRFSLIYSLIIVVFPPFLFFFLFQFLVQKELLVVPEIRTDIVDIATDTLENVCVR